MMHAVHNTVNPGAHIGRSLGNVGKEIKYLFPKGAHSKSLVRGIPVLKKGLREQSQVPMQYEEEQYDHDELLLNLQVKKM
jgi:hypothetical protein